MGDIRNEPSMEEILASIKRIIAEDSVASPPAPRQKRGSAPVATPPEPQEPPMEQAARKSAEPQESEEVLELTESIDSSAASAPDPISPKEADMPQPAPAAADPRLVSEPVVSASRDALAALSALIVKPEVHADNTLEGLVREMLKPMLKEWLDAKLPDLVEKLVEKEIGRITGRTL